MKHANPAGSGLQEAVTGMRVGGIRRVIVPEELGYPGSFDTLGPVPTTFSGKRTLDFGERRAFEGARGEGAKGESVWPVSACCDIERSVRLLSQCSRTAA